MRRAVALGGSVARQQLRRHVRRDLTTQCVFVSHPIDASGAPLVLLQVVAEYATSGRPERIRLIAPSWFETVAAQLDALPIKVEKGAQMSPRFIGMQLALRRDDFVLLNTCAAHPAYVDYVLAALESGMLAHGHWFLHEEVEQLRAWSPRLLAPPYLARISRLVNNGSLRVLVPSAGLKRRYDETFATEEVATIAYRIEVPEHYLRPRSADGFRRLDFLLAGPPFQGRKGHAFALDAFREFMETSYRINPGGYRDFSLQFVGFSGTDPLSREITQSGTALLGGRLRIAPPLPRSQALDVISRCNAVICCSLSEAFPLVVAEAMLMRQLVLRNDCSGVDEQLRDGENGYFIGHNDIRRFAGAIERVLNVETTSDEALKRMGDTSHTMIAPYAASSYMRQIDALGGRC